MTTLPLHPDDVLLFTEVATAMRKVAGEYKLPLRSVEGMPMPKDGMVDCKGDCSSSGHIRLVLRCTENGTWCDAPRSPEDVWNTAAHELAHLRHFNHGDAFSTLHAELRSALKNARVDHREKVLEKLVKLQSARQGEAELGNTEAAEAFARAINKMLIENELNPSDLDYARASDKDPIVEIMVDLARYGIDKKGARSAWQETLARVVAKAHLCTFLLRPGSNQIWFVGTHSHATVAEYVYGTLVPAAATMSRAEELKYWRETGCGRFGENKAKGFRAAWLEAFVQRIEERFVETRRQAVAAVPEGQGSTALIRLNGAMTKVNDYVNDKFKARRRQASSLARNAASHSEGASRGRAAAERVTLGRKALTSTATGSRKMLTA